MEHITLRITTAGASHLIVDEVGSANLEEPEEIMKLLENLLTKLQYTPQLNEMYADDSLLILKFNKEPV